MKIKLVILSILLLWGCSMTTAPKEEIKSVSENIEEVQLVINEPMQDTIKKEEKLTTNEYLQKENAVYNKRQEHIEKQIKTLEDQQETLDSLLQKKKDSKK